MFAQLDDSLRHKKYDDLIARIVAERDARLEKTEPDKVSAKGKRRLSKDRANLMNLRVYVNNATTDFAIVDKRDAHESALYAEGYIFFCRLLARDEEIKSKAAEFATASRRAEETAALLSTAEAREKYNKKREEGFDVGVSPEMAYDVLHKRRWLGGYGKTADEATSEANALALHANTLQTIKTFRETGRRANPYKFAEAVEVLYKHCYFNGVGATLAHGVTPFVVMASNDKSAYDWDAEIVASSQIAELAQKIKSLVFRANLSKDEFRSRYPDLRYLTQRVLTSGLCDYIDKKIDSSEE